MTMIKTMTVTMNDDNFFIFFLYGMFGVNPDNDNFEICIFVFLNFVFLNFGFLNFGFLNFGFFNLDF